MEIFNVFYRNRRALKWVLINKLFTCFSTKHLKADITIKKNISFSDQALIALAQFSLLLIPFYRHQLYRISSFD